MNLLLINYEFPPIGAGAATATYHIGKELALMGHGVNVMTSGYKGLPNRAVVDGMNLLRCPALRKKKSESNVIEMLSFVMSAFLHLPFVVKKRKIEGIIAFFGFPCGPLALWAHILFKTPYIVSLRGGDVPGTDRSMDYFHKLLKPLRRLIYKKSRAVVANSQGLKTISLKTDPVPSIVIPNGVDTSYFRPAPKRIENDCFSFIFVGRLCDQKNLFFLMDQLSTLKKEMKEPFSLHIVGDGPIKEKLRLYTESLGISDRIKWHGWLTKQKAVKLLQESDCFINPSLCEGMPNAVLEAMACGLPVIASDVAGNNAVVIDGENGLLFHLNDSLKMVDSLKTVMANHGLRLNLGKKARKKLAERFSWQTTASAYANCFDTYEINNKDFG